MFTQPDSSAARRCRATGRRCDPPTSSLQPCADLPCPNPRNPRNPRIDPRLMDPFSHIVFGRTLAAVRTPRGRGMIPAVMLGALAPDADAVLMPFGWDIYLRAHEVGTHSALGCLAMAALTALAVRLFVRGSRYPAL